MHQVNILEPTPRVKDGFFRVFRRMSRDLILQLVFEINKTVVGHADGGAGVAELLILHCSEEAHAICFHGFEDIDQIVDIRGWFEA